MKIITKNGRNNSEFRIIKWKVSLTIPNKICNEDTDVQNASACMHSIQSVPFCY